VFDRVDSSWSLELLKGVEKAARENSLSVIVSESGDRTSQAPNWLEGVLHRRPVGVILVFSDLRREDKQQLRARNIPFVIVDPAGNPAPDVPSIGSGNWSGGFEATTHLIELGHRRIAMITGSDNLMCSRARVAGYRSALEAAHLEVDEALIAPGDFGRDSGIAATEHLLSLSDPPTAIFAGNDMQAFGAYEAAAARGLQVPQDLSVVGYDDIDAASWVTPRLTTVRQPLAEMAEEATRLVIRLRSEPDSGTARLDLATGLVLRESTEPPKRPRD
jgi:LacI family xylobiose transport system transcriptional regulator